MTETPTTTVVATIDTEALMAQGRNQYHAELLELTRLCQLSRMPEKLATLIEQQLTVDQAREYLMAALAEQTGPEIVNAIPVTNATPENPLIQAAKARINATA